MSGELVVQALHISVESKLLKYKCFMDIDDGTGGRSEQRSSSPWASLRISPACLIGQT